MKKTLLAVALAPLCLQSQAFASDTTHQEDELVVISRSIKEPLHIAANVNVIDSYDIEKSGATNLTELLRGRSGIQVSDSNSGPVFAMRGFSGSQAANNTLILVDGRRLNNIDIAAPSISAIPLNQIERIELLSGSAGVLYGDQAVGGVINIVTKAPDSTGGNLRLSGGSFNTYEGQGDVSGSLADDWRYYLAGSYNQGDNYRDHNANETGSILGRVQYQTEKNQFFVETSYYDNRRELAGSLTLDQINENPRQANSSNSKDFNHEKTTAARAGYQHQLTEDWSLGADLNYSDTDVETVSWGSPGKNERSLLEFTPKAVANITTDKGELNIVTGLDLSRGESEFSSGRSNEQNVTSIYVQANIPQNQKLSYVIGGRYAEAKDDLTDKSVYPNGVKLDQDAHAFELGLNYRPSFEHRVYLRADDNFRFAKVDEQAYTSPGVVGLKPQTGRSYEAGWDWNPDSHSLRLSLYRLDLEDEIVFDPSAEKPVGGAFNGANLNADASRRYGANFAWDWLLNDMFQFGLEYSYIDAEFTEGANNGKSLSWVAEHSGRGYLSVDITSNWQLFTEAVYTGERFLEGDNANVDPKLDDYILGNLALNYSRDVWLASLRVDNLFDEQYVSSGFYSEFGNGYYSGTGRAVRLTASYSF